MTVLRSFGVGENSRLAIDHTINLEDDATTFQLRGGRSLCRVDSSGVMRSPLDQIIGRFKMNADSKWYFDFENQDERIQSNLSDLLQFEREVFKTLYSRNVVY
jgi:hypothetical protein